MARGLARLRSAGNRFITAVVDTSEVPPNRRPHNRECGRIRVARIRPLPRLALPLGATTIEYNVADIAYANCRHVAAGSYRILIHGAIDAPSFGSETGPLLLASLSQTGFE